MDDMGSQEVPKPDVGDDRIMIKRRRRTSPPLVHGHHHIFEDVVNAVSDGTTASIHILNDECLDLILSHFTTDEHFKLGLVCRRWYNMCRTKISLLTSFRCNSMAQCSSVVSLNCGNLTLLQFDLEFSLKEAFTGYQSFEGHNTIFETISKNCPNLLGLDLSSTDIDHRMSKQLSQNFPKKLKYLSLSVNEEACLGRILMKAESLEKLYLSQILSLKALSGNIDGLSITKHLVHNNMKSFSFVGFRKELNLTVLEFILNNYRSSLEHLNLSRSGAGLLELNHSKKFPNMKRLFASGTAPVVYHDGLILMDLQKLSRFLQLMPNLRLLDLTGNCDLQSYPMFFKYVAEACPLLESLNLSQCNLLAENLIHLKNFRFLKKLKMFSLDSGCRNSMRHENYYFVSFDFSFFAEHIVGGLKALEYLDIECIPKLSDKHVFSIIRNLHDNTDCVLNIEPYELSGSFIEQCHSVNRSFIVDIILGIIMVSEEDGIDNTTVLDYYRTAKIPQFMRIREETSENNSDNYMRCSDRDSDPWFD